MLKIRLSRTGRKNLASYRIVVSNQRDKRDGRSLDILGSFDPRSNPRKIIINKDLTKEWIRKGAQPTDTVKALFIKEGIMPKARKAKKFNEKPGKKAQLRAKKQDDNTAPTDSK